MAARRSRETPANPEPEPDELAHLREVYEGQRDAILGRAGWSAEGLDVGWHSSLPRDTRRTDTGEPVTWVSFSSGGTAQRYDALQVAVGSNALFPPPSWAEPRHGAMEYNLGRTGESAYTLPVPFDGAQEPVVAVTREPLSSASFRVLAVLQGAWEAEGMEAGCRPWAPEHTPGCPCSRNRVAYTKAAVARATFGEDGGRQIQLVERALEELGHDTTAYYLWDPRTRQYGRQVSHILSFRELGELPAYARPGDLDPQATGYIAWDPFLHESLMAAHYSRLPLELVRELSGADYLVWLAVVLQPETGRLQRAGEWREYSVSGQAPLLNTRRLGLGRQRPDKLRASLERAAERGNAIAGRTLGLELSVADRTDRRGGLKLVVRRIRDRAAPVLQDGSSPVLQDGSGVHQDADPRTSGRRPPYIRTRIEHKTAPLDGSTDGSTDEIRDRARRARRASLSVGTEGRTERPRLSWDTGGAVMDAWRLRYPRPPTPRQLDKLAELVAKNDAAGIARALREAPPDVDAFGHVMGRDRRDQAELRRETARRDRPIRTPTPEPEREPTPEQRAEAIRFLRGVYGASGPLADTLRARYRLTDADIWPERAETSGD